ncbi:MAG: hypothetical protein QOF06_1497, partial [Solirubrobacterales bacterium]|nr:hypothetical protein [Solirubrobacterales bacterium]
VALLAADFGNDTRLARWTVTMGALAILGSVAAWLVGRLSEQQERIARHTGSLRLAETRMRQILQTAQDGHVILDADGVLLDANEAAEQLLGRARADMVGQRFADFAFAPEDAARHHERRAQMLAEGGRRRFEVDLMHADGTRVPVEKSAAVIEVDGDKLVAGFLHDLRGRRQRERDRRIAETLQRSLLPEQLPDLAGVELAARYEPAAGEADVGGDWYDAMVLNGDSLAIAMGDVAGKGLAAAAMVGRLRSALRAYAFEHDDPAVVVDRLNRLLASEPTEIELTTLLFAVLSPSSGRLAWVNAGHPAPLVVPEHGEPTWLTDGLGIPLGAMTSPGYRVAETVLPAGALLLLYTDGVVERPSRPLDEGFARLAREAGAARGDTATLVDAVVRGSANSGGGHDDVAVLAVRALPLGARLALTLPARADSLSAMRGTLRRWLGEQRDVSAEEAGRIVLAVHEACTNAVEHARGAGADSYRLVAEAADGELVISVHNAGAWRPERDAPEGGRGLHIMRGIMDSVDVETAAASTTVRLRRRPGR